MGKTKLCIVIAEWSGTERVNSLVGGAQSFDLLRLTKMRLRLQKAEFVKRLLAELDRT